MFDGDDRVNNNEFDGGLLDDETFPEVELIDDDLDVSFGKLPNVVRSLPSERVKQEVKPLSVAKNGATIGVRNGVTNGERNGVRNGVAATNGVRNGVGTRFPASKSTIGLGKRPSRLGDGDSQSTRSLVQKPDIKKTAVSLDIFLMKNRHCFDKSIQIGAQFVHILSHIHRSYNANGLYVSACMVNC